MKIKHILQCFWGKHCWSQMESRAEFAQRFREIGMNKTTCRSSPPSQRDTVTKLESTWRRWKSGWKRYSACAPRKPSKVYFVSIMLCQPWWVPLRNQLSLDFIFLKYFAIYSLKSGGFRMLKIFSPGPRLKIGFVYSWPGEDVGMMDPFAEYFESRL